MAEFITVHGSNLTLALTTKEISGSRAHQNDLNAATAQLTPQALVESHHSRPQVINRKNRTGAEANSEGGNKSCFWPAMFQKACEAARPLVRRCVCTSECTLLCTAAKAVVIVICSVLCVTRDTGVTYSALVHNAASEPLAAPHYDTTELVACSPDSGSALPGGTPHREQARPRVRRPQITGATSPVRTFSPWAILWC